MTDRPETGERIAKVMARAGVASRRDAERLIVEGRVSVNGKKVTSPALDVLPGDRVTLDGKPIDAPQPARVWLYYKPLGLVTSEKDEKGRQTVFESLPDGMPRVMSVGRLDLNSEGLLLLTNDGDLKRKLELPSTGWLRKYRVRVNGRPNEATFDPLKRGITIDGEEFQPMEIHLDRQQGANAWLTVGLREGKNREIRRAMAEVGLTVNRLIRVSYGPFRLNEMKPGEVIEVKARVLRDQLGEKPTRAEDEEAGRGRGERPARKPGTGPRERSERPGGRGPERRDDRGERGRDKPERREFGTARGAGDRRPGGAPGEGGPRKSFGRPSEGFAPRGPRQAASDGDQGERAERPRKPRHGSGPGARPGADRGADRGYGGGERRSGPQGDRPPRKTEGRDGDRPARSFGGRREDRDGKPGGRDGYKGAGERKSFGGPNRSGGKGPARDGAAEERPSRGPKREGKFGDRAGGGSGGRGGAGRSFGDRDAPRGKFGAKASDKAGDRPRREGGGFAAGSKPKAAGKGGSGFKAGGGADRPARGPRPKPGGDKPRKG
ncbi:pseudouridine synthase [Frigidibacter sp. RF13]|uniref:pseudouridine synthase n=1 Tax=Frigidibacter sp. RF13 TaxID=2997340 RepID=UPI00226D8AFD|nr:pseudouridine synthase [Frigidibacter sp. RF13]MCY1125557.1 pseudouridine synthase [Frigidibacter sp. RF13]